MIKFILDRVLSILKREPEQSVDLNDLVFELKYAFIGELIAITDADIALAIQHGIRKKLIRAEKKPRIPVAGFVLQRKESYEKLLCSSINKNPIKSRKRDYNGNLIENRKNNTNYGFFVDNKGIIVEGDDCKQFDDIVVIHGTQKTVDMDMDVENDDTMSHNQ